MNESITIGPLLRLEELDVLADFQKLKDLDNHLKCSICYDYFNTCVITHCSHNFCSLCIRRYIQYKTECPACYSELYDSQLRPNRIVDTFVENYPVLKERIIKQLRALKTLKPNQVYSSPSKKSKDMSPVNKRQSSEAQNEKVTEQTAAVLIQPVAAETVSVSCSPSSSCNKITIPLMFQSPSKKSTPGPMQSNINLVPCPVCSVEVRDVYINSHLDDCLNRPKDSEKKCIVEKRTHLPKLVLGLMSLNALRSKAKSYGLSSQGDADTLKNRIQRYTVLYNAECDKPYPRHVSVIMKMLENEEKAISSQKMPKTIFPITSESKDKVNTQYLKDNKNSFDQLVTMVRSKLENRKVEKENENTSQDTIIQCEPSTSKMSTSWDAIEKINIEEMEIATSSQKSVPMRDPSTHCNGVNKIENGADGDDFVFTVTRNRAKSRRLNFDSVSLPDAPNPIEFVKIETTEDAFEKLTDEDTDLAEQNLPDLNKRKRRERITYNTDSDSPELIQRTFRKRKRH